MRLNGLPFYPRHDNTVGFGWAPHYERYTFGWIIDKQAYLKTSRKNYTSGEMSLLEHIKRMVLKFQGKKY